MIRTVTRASSPRKEGKNRTGMDIEASSQSKIMVTTSCNLLLAQTGRCQVEEDCLCLTDLGDRRGNEVEVFKVLKDSEMF